MKIFFLIAFCTAFVTLFSCKKNASEEIPPVKVQRMKTLLTNQWKLTGYYYEDSSQTNSFPIIITFDYFAFAECMRNSKVSFSNDEKGTITNTCFSSDITTRWHFSEDSVQFKYQWSTMNISRDSIFQFMYFTPDSIAMMQKGTDVSSSGTHYTKYVLQLKKQ